MYKFYTKTKFSLFAFQNSIDLHQIEMKTKHKLVFQIFTPPAPNFWIRHYLPTYFMQYFSHLSQTNVPFHLSSISIILHDPVPRTLTIKL